MPHPGDVTCQNVSSLVTRCEREVFSIKQTFSNLYLRICMCIGSGGSFRCFINTLCSTKVYIEFGDLP